MTFASMDSSDAVPEAENNEVLETVESQEIVEQAQQNDLATFDSAAAVDTGMDYAEAETVENAFTEVMQAAVTEAPESVTGAANEPVDGPLPPYDSRDDNSADGHFDPPSGASPSDGGEVMIDTVPLPEKPSRMEQAVPSEAVDRVAIIDTNDGPRIAPDGINDVAIIDSNDGPVVMSKVDTAGIIDTNDGPRTAPNGMEGVSIIDSNDGPNAIGLSPDDVKIDTVPLPEKPETISSQTVIDAGDEVAIGTWPTPERTVDVDRNLDGAAIIDSNDSPRLGDDRVKIDTVPLPEDGLDGVAIIDSNDGPRLGDDRVKIDTVPLPEDDLDGVAIIDSNDGPRTADQMKAGMEDALRDDLRMGEQGYMGEVGLPKGGEIPETGIGDPIGGIDGALGRVPGKVDDPFDSIPEWGETADGQNLEDAAAAGANPLVGSVRSVAGYVWGLVCGSNDTGGSGSAGVRGTPTPDSVEGSFEDPIGGIEIKEKTPTDYADSMMQPVDDEGQGREQPGMKMSAKELRDAQLNPYIQNTDEHVDVLPGSRDDMTNPKDLLIDNDLEPFAPGSGGGTNPLAKPSTNDDAPPPPPPGGGKPGVSMGQMMDDRLGVVDFGDDNRGDGMDDRLGVVDFGDDNRGDGMDDRLGVVDFGDDTIEGNNGPRESMVSSKPPDGGDGKPPDGADLVGKPSTNDDVPPPPPPGGGKPGVSMEQMEGTVSSKPPDGGDGKPPDGADLNLVTGLEDSLAPDSAPVDLSGMMDGGTMLNANENKNLKDLDESNAQNLEPGDGKL